MHDTDFILLRCELANGAGLDRAARELCERSGLPLTLHRAAWSPGTRLAYVYGRLPARERLGDAVRSDIARLWAQLCPAATATDVSRLELVFDAPGRSAGAAPRHHYTVETDPEAGWFDEIARWYDIEHMPGLAAVEGCIRALRFLNPDAGPRSLACYDLTSENTLQRPEWLAVRHSAWSDIARPHFTNTRRTMMRVVA